MARCRACRHRPDRRRSAGGRAAWWTAIVQSAGTLFFNPTTGYALHVTVSSAQYDRLVWRPDALGSVCFLACAIASLLTGATSKLLHGRRISAWEHDAIAEADNGVAEVERLR